MDGLIFNQMPDQMLDQLLNGFHFLRPLWLWALIPWLALIVLLFKRRYSSRNWRAVCDPRLLSKLLIGRPAQDRRWPALLIGLAGLLAIIALAGPAWHQIEQPVFREESALILALDLSRSMDATDIKPNRLARARHKIKDILVRRTEGQTGLIVFSSEAFTVSPLTHDAATISSLVSSLDTQLMPSQGSRPETALQLSAKLLTQAGATNGDVLLITDGLDSAIPEKAIASLVEQGHRLSVLGIGTADGAPIALSGGGFVKDNNGAIVIPKMDASLLHSMALQGGGRYTTLTTDDQDLDYLEKTFSFGGLNAETEQTGLKADLWREEGPWILLLLIPFAALAFRRGYLVILVALCLPVADPASAFEWQDLWLNPDQQAARAFSRGDHQTASRLFEDPEWKAAADYRNGQYQQSIEDLENLDSVEAMYNKGNALAKSGKLSEAIQAYDKVLELAPDHQDARYNKELVSQLMPEQQQDGEGEQSEVGEQSEQENQDSEQNNSGNNSSGQQNETREEQDQASDQQDQQGQQDQQQSGKDGEEPNQQDNKDQQEQSEQEEQAEAMKQQDQKDQQEQQQRTEEELNEQTETRQANEQWLRRIPDDPGGLLRRKFRYQYQRRQQSSQAGEQSW